MLTTDTDVIIKRGIDTIRICVVPAKTNTKVLTSCSSVDIVHSMMTRPG